MLRPRQIIEKQLGNKEDLLALPHLLMVDAYDAKTFAVLMKQHSRSDAGSASPVESAS